MAGKTNKPATEAAAESREAFLPALRFRWLTPLFDRAIHRATREDVFKPALLEQAGLRGNERVLDLGCGTGTLALLVKDRAPGCEIVGVDADEQILAIARAKASAAGAQLQFDQAFSTALPYEDASFDRVLSTLFFHHLDSETKEATLREVHRVLRPGGELHVADWTAPADPLQLALSWPVRIFDGVSRTRENFTGQLPQLLQDAGFQQVREGSTFRTIFGTLGLLRASRPAGSAL